MTTKLNRASAKYVVQWDHGEVPFRTTKQAQTFIDKICKKTAPSKNYGILEVIPLAGLK